MCLRAILVRFLKPAESLPEWSLRCLILSREPSISPGTGLMLPAAPLHARAGISAGDNRERTTEDICGIGPGKERVKCS